MQKNVSAKPISWIHENYVNVQYVHTAAVHFKYQQMFLFQFQLLCVQGPGDINMHV